MTEPELRILLVANARSMLGSLATHLRDKYRYTVDTAVGSEEAWELMIRSGATYRVALIELLSAPRIGEENNSLGIDLMNRVMAICPYIQVIVLTDSAEDGLDAVRKGAFRCLVEPVNADEVAMVVSSAVEYQELKGAAREKQILEQLMETSAALLDGQNQREVLDRILRGVQSIGFDCVRLFEFVDDKQLFVGIDQKGMGEGFVGFEWPVADFPYIDNLRDRRCHVFNRREGGSSRFEEWLVKEGIHQWASVLLIRGGKVIGKLSADNRITGRAIREEQLGPFALFASQAAAAIENARLFSEVERRARNLRAVLQVSTEISSSLNLNRALNAACRAAVELLGVNHSGLMLFDANLASGEVIAEYPEIGTRGLVIPLRGVPVEERLVGFKEPIVVSDIADDPSFNPVRDILVKRGITSLLIVPIVFEDRLLGSLGLDSIGARAFSEEEIELCKVFASQVATAIENGQLYQQTKQRAEELEAFRHSTLAITSQSGIEDILRIVIQHAVELLRAKDGGIYQYHREREELYVIADYGQPDQIGMTLKVGEGMAGLLVQSGDPYMVVDDYDKWSGKARVYADKHRFGAVLEVSLQWQGRFIGVLYVNDDVGRKFTAKDARSLSLFANIAAIAIDHTQLFQQTVIAKKRLRASYEASNALVASPDPEQGLKDIVEQARLAADASWIRLVLIDEVGQRRNLVTTETGKHLDTRDVIRRDGITLQVMKTGKAAKFEDTYAQSDLVNPVMFEEGSAAALCLPFSVRGKRIGVMWIHYDRPRQFAEFEIDALQLYLNQAAVAYDSARQMQELEQMRKAAERLAEAGDVQQVMEQTALCARAVLRADSTLAFPYDEGRKRFDLEDAAVVGVSEEGFRIGAPGLGGITERVMRQRWIGIDDIDDDQRYGFLGEQAKDSFKQRGVKSFQGIALMAAGEVVGVLYANYNHICRFNEEQRKTAQTFANVTAVALKKAKLLDQVRKAKKAAEVVADVTVLGDFKKTLESVARGTEKATGCDAVALSVYDDVADRLDPMPTMVGVLDYKRASNCYKVSPDSLVYQMLRQNRPYVVENTAEDVFFKDSRFAREEKIESCMAIPLKVAEHRVGVMFVNYRKKHHFTTDERSNIELFANQAAVAIRNAQLYDDREKKGAHLIALYEAGKTITRASLGLERRRVLDQIVEQAVKCVENSHGHKAFLGTFQSYDEETQELLLESAYPRSELPNLVERIGEKRSLDRERLPDKRIGITGRAGLERKPQLVQDVTSDPDYAMFSSLTRSELAVPLFDQDKVVAVLNVESSQTAAFDDDDTTTLQALAELAAIVIRNARVYEELKAQTALAWMGMETSTWRHTIEGHAVTIRGAVSLLHRALEHTNLKATARNEVEEKLALIERLATEIFEKPITPPLSSEEGVREVSINDLIGERVSQLSMIGPYERIAVRRNLTAEDTTVVISSEWFVRAFDILLENGVEAMANADNPLLTITTRRRNGRVEISIADKGPGISQEILENLFNEPIQKRGRKKGFGMGLLMAQAIIRTYGGDIRVESTGGEGTTMTLWLPWKGDANPTSKLTFASDKQPDASVAASRAR